MTWKWRQWAMLGLFGWLTGCGSLQFAPGPASAKSTPVGTTNAPAANPEVSQVVAAAAARPPTPLAGEGWTLLFDGKTLAGWGTSEFGGRGPVECDSGLIVVGMGDALTGIRCTNDVPTMNYEVALEAMKLDGSDFFCGLTFPVGGSHCSLILGGWGGALVGISSIDGQDASENETTQFMNFEKEKWYCVRVRVTLSKIEAWLDDKQIVDVKTEGHKISLRYGEIELSKPLGVATYQTTAAFREIKLRRLEEPASAKQ